MIRTRLKLGTMRCYLPADADYAALAKGIITSGDLAIDPHKPSPKDLTLDENAPNVVVTEEGKSALRFTIVASEFLAGSLHDDTVVDLFSTAPQRNRLDDAKKLAIITEYLHGGESQKKVQQRHGLGHSTLSAWMKSFGITPRDEAAEKKTLAAERENKRLLERVARLEATEKALRKEVAMLQSKIRKARNALILSTKEEGTIQDDA